MEYVIFTSPIALISLVAIAALYALVILTKKFNPGAKGFIGALSIINLIAHVWLLVLYLYIKASMQEILFVYVASSVAALTVTKQRKGEK